MSAYGTFARRGAAAASDDPPPPLHWQPPDRNAAVPLVSRALFLFVAPLAVVSRARRLQLRDLWPLAAEDTSSGAATRLRAEYARFPSLAMALVRGEWRALGSSALFAMLAVAAAAAVPLLIFRLLTLVMAAQAHEAMGEVLLLLAAIHASAMIGEVCDRHSQFRMFRAELRAVAAIRALVFEKSIETTQGSRRPAKGNNIAAIATIYSSSLIDAGSLVTGIHIAWMTAMKLVVLLYILDATLQVSAKVIASSLTSICFAMLLLTFVAAKAHQKATKKHTKTLNRVYECFKGIQAVKLNAWEDKMRHKVFGARAKEEAKHLRVVLLRTLRFSVIWESPALASIAIFYFLAVHDRYFSPATVFTALVLFDRIQVEIKVLILGARVYIDGVAALRRIQKYLRHCDASPKSEMAVSRTDSEQRYPPNVVVAVEGASYTATSESSSDFILANVNVRVRVGELVVVHGKAGAGKSTLLASLLGEVARARGHVYVSGECKIAYCPEEPWLQTLSVRDNILFGEEYSERKYLRILDVCCLVEDLNALPDGEATMVGPKGINLSGGQKARIALARALYSDADLFILDCPLAAADAVVQAEVFRKCFLELLRHKTVIMATHNPEIISSEFVDRLWCVDSKSVNEIDRNRPTSSDASGSDSHQRGGSDRSSHSSRRVRRLADRPPWRSSAQASLRPTEFMPDKLEQVGSSPAPLPQYQLAFQRTAKSFEDQDSTLKSEVERLSISTDIAKELLWNHGRAAAVIWIALFVVYGSLGVAKNFWLLHWSALPMKHVREDAMRRAATMYGALICGALAVVLSASLVLCHSLFVRSRKMFKDITNSLLRAPMDYFYRTPIGEILLRYSSDMQASDQFIFGQFVFALHSLLSIAAAVGTLCYILGGTGALIAVATVYICREIAADHPIVQIFMVRDKLDAINLNYVSEALDGSAVIRAFGVNQVERFRAQHAQMVDKRSRIAYAAEVFFDWSLIRYSLMVGAFLVLVAVILAFGSISPGELGLVLHCIFTIQRELVSFLCGVLSVTTQLTSITNLLESQQIDPEEQESSQKIQESVAWPKKGDIVFEGVWFQYSSSSDLRPPADRGVALPSQRYALRNVSLSIRGGEKVGVVGRTGSGKSTLAMALFRVHEPARGRILIDGIDISRLRLGDLRSRLCIIPQTPLFYRCSVRRYLDPFDEFDDATLWKALKRTGLSVTDAQDPTARMSEQEFFVRSLEKQLDENGENWSMGERQMLVVTRALLKPSRILILDEPFSSVDQASDKRLLEVVANEFSLSTVFLITHRLDQVLDFDRIIVMRDGELVETGTAQELVADPDSAFYEFLETTLLTF